MDREVNVRVNVQPGSDNMTPQLRQQQEAAERLQRSLDEARQKASQAPAPAPAAEALRQARPAAARLNEQIAQREGVGPEPGSPMAARLESLRQQRAAMQPAVTAPPARGESPAINLIPEGQITSAERGLSGLLGRVRELGQQSGIGRVTGGLEQVGAMGTRAASSITSIAGVAGLAAGAVGLIGGAAAGLAAILRGIVASFQQVLTSAQELNSRLEQSRSITRDVRAQGAPTGEQFETAFANRPGVLQRLRGATPQQARQILEQERTQAEADVAELAARNPEEAGGQLNDMLRRQREERNAPGGRNTIARARQLQERFTLLHQLGVRTADVPAGLLENMDLSDEQIAQFARAPRAGLANAQARQQVARSALQEGALPNLREGGLSLRDLPNIFQSRQGDVLDIHAQVQQEAVRDERQQAQFNQQMALWSQILDGIMRLNGQPGVAQPNPPAVG